MGEQCSHGQLQRVCLLCEKDETIARMREALTTTAGNIRSLGAANALNQVPMPYRIWLEVVEAALKNGELHD